MSNKIFPLFFQPHVGANYFLTGYYGKRILILGHTYPCNESGIQLDAEHTCLECNNPNKPNGICRIVISKFIEEHLHGKLKPSQNKTFTSVEKAIMKDNYCENEVHKFWDSVIFSEYVQSAVKEGERVGETYSNYYEASIDSFIEVLQRYSPEYILSWGSLVFEKVVVNLCKKGIEVQKTNCKVNDYNFDYAKIKLNEKEIKMLKMHHPCQGFGNAEWKVKIEKFLEL